MQIGNCSTCVILFVDSFGLEELLLLSFARDSALFLQNRCYPSLSHVSQLRMFLLVFRITKTTLNCVISVLET